MISTFSLISTGVRMWSFFITSCTKDYITKWCKKQRENKNMAQTKETYIILIYSLMTYNTSILQEQDADKPDYTCCMNT